MVSWLITQTYGPKYWEGPYHLVYRWEQVDTVYQTRRVIQGRKWPPFERGSSNAWWPTHIPAKRWIRLKIGMFVSVTWTRVTEQLVFSSNWQQKQSQAEKERQKELEEKKRKQRALYLRKKAEQEKAEEERRKDEELGPGKFVFIVSLSWWIHNWLLHRPCSIQVGGIVRILTLQMLWIVWIRRLEVEGDTSLRLVKRRVDEGVNPLFSDSLDLP